MNSVKIYTLCLAILTTAACEPIEPESIVDLSKVEKISLTSEQVLAVQVGVSSSLKDPYSARFGGIAAAKDNESGTINVCGLVNAKNSFGAFTGSKWYSGVLTDIPGLSPHFFPVGIGGDESEQLAIQQQCRLNGVF